VIVSAISNVIGSYGKNETNHLEVIENSKKAEKTFIPLVKRVIEKFYEGRN